MARKSDAANAAVEIAFAVSRERLMEAHVMYALQLTEHARGKIPVTRALDIYARLHHLSDEEIRLLNNRVLAAFAQRGEGPLAAAAASAGAAGEQGAAAGAADRAARDSADDASVEAEDDAKASAGADAEDFTGVNADANADDEAEDDADLEALEWEPPSSLFKRIRKRLRGRVNTNLRRWVELHTGHTEYEILQIHAENVQRVLDAAGDDGGAILDTVKYYVEKLAVRERIFEAIYIMTLHRLNNSSRDDDTASARRAHEHGDQERGERGERLERREHRGRETSEDEAAEEFPRKRTVALRVVNNDR